MPLAMSFRYYEEQGIDIVLKQEPNGLRLEIIRRDTGRSLLTIDMPENIVLTDQRN